MNEGQQNAPAAQMPNEFLCGGDGEAGHVVRDPEESKPEVRRQGQRPTHLCPGTGSAVARRTSNTEWKSRSPSPSHQISLSSKRGSAVI